MRLSFSNMSVCHKFKKKCFLHVLACFYFEMILTFDPSAALKRWTPGEFDAANQEAAQSSGWKVTPVSNGSSATIMDAVKKQRRRRRRHLCLDTSHTGADGWMLQSPDGTKSWTAGGGRNRWSLGRCTPTCRVETCSPALTCWEHLWVSALWKHLETSVSMKIHLVRILFSVLVTSEQAGQKVKWAKH